MRRGNCRFCYLPASECLCDDEDDEVEPVTDIDCDALIAAVRESGIALKPGDVLAVRLPMSASSYEVDNARAYARTVEAETGVKVAFIPGEEFARTTVNITVNGFTGSQDELVRELYGQIQKEAVRHGRRNGGAGN